MENMPNENEYPEYPFDLLSEAELEGIVESANSPQDLILKLSQPEITNKVVILSSGTPYKMVNQSETIERTFSFLYTNKIPKGESKNLMWFFKSFLWHITTTGGLRKKVRSLIEKEIESGRYDQSGWSGDATHRFQERSNYVADFIIRSCNIIDDVVYIMLQHPAAIIRSEKILYLHQVLLAVNTLRHVKPLQKNMDLLPKNFSDIEQIIRELVKKEEGEE
jgi:hypothetical protein